MNKKTIIISLVILIALLVIIGFAYFIFREKISKNQIKDLSSVSGQEIVKILEANKDVKEYTQKYNDFKIESKEILTTDSILAGQKGQDFQAVYDGLELQDNRYMKINLMNQVGNNGFVAVIDFKDNSVPKAFGILLFQASAEAIQNGQK